MREALRSVRDLPVFIGALLRIVLGILSRGSNDIAAWQHFAKYISENGMGKAYAFLPELNHPPIPCFWSIGVYELFKNFHTRFDYIFKLPSIVADVGTIFLIRAYALSTYSRSDKRHCIYALSLPAIIIGSYHGNTDAICVFFLMLSIYLLAIPNRPFLAGLALAAAVNVKVIPLLIVPPLLVTLSDFRSLIRFLAALSLGAIPFMLMVALDGPQILYNIFTYRSYPEHWGLNFPLFDLSSAPSPLYPRYGGILIWSGIILLSLLQWKRRCFDYLTVAALSLCILLIFAPGFAVQYLIYIAPFIALVAPRLAIIYSLISGVFLLACYYHFLDLALPLASYHWSYFPPHVAVMGLCIWLSLLYFFWQLIHLKKSSGTGMSLNFYAERS